MSASAYDEAIVSDLRKIFKNDDKVMITPVDTVLRTVADLRSDKIKLPLLNLTRVGFSLRKTDGNHSTLFTGAPVNDKYVQVVPISLRYQLDVWTKFKKDNDNLVRELIFYYMLNPTRTVEVPYGIGMSHTFNIRLDQDIPDNSDIIAHGERGEYFRQSLTLYVDDAYLFKSNQDPVVELTIDSVNLRYRDHEGTESESIKEEPL